MPAKRASAAQLSAIRRAADTRRLLTTLRDQGAYPPTVSELASQLGEAAADTLRWLTSKPQQAEFLVIAKNVAAPAGFRSDAVRMLGSECMLRYAAAAVRQKRLSKHKPLRANRKKFLGDTSIGKPLQAEFARQVEYRHSQGTLPAEVLDLLSLPPIEIAQQLVAYLAEFADPGKPPGTLSPQSLCTAVACDLRDPSTKQAFQHAVFTSEVVTCIDPSSRQTICIPRAKWADFLPSLVAAAFGKLASVRTSVFTAKELAAVIAKDRRLRAELAAGIESAGEHRSLGDQVGWLVAKGQRLFFRLADIATGGRTALSQVPAPNSTARTVGDFAQDFHEAFRNADLQGGGGNLVKVHDLRLALPGYSREQFDAGLRLLRVNGEYSMEAAHGGTVRLSEAELRSGIREGSSLLVYVSRG